MVTQNPLLNKLRKQKTELTAQQQTLVDAAEKEDRRLNEDENTAFEAARTAKEGLDDRIEKLSSLLEAEVTVAPVETAVADGTGRITNQRESFVQDPKKGFPTSCSFFKHVYDATTAGKIEDQRMRFLACDKNGVAIHQRKVDENGMPIGITAGSDEQSTFADPYGGFFVPEAFSPGPLMVEPEPINPLMRPTMIPMASPVVTINARVDKDHSNSVSGGFRVYRRAESDQSASSRAAYEQVVLTADTLYGVAYATEELLRDSPVSFAAIIQAGFADEYPNKEMDERIRGTGVGEFEGLLNADAKIDVSKESPQTADTIVTQNIQNMRIRAWRYGQCVWMYNPDCLSQLMNLTVTIGASGVLIWQENARTSEPATLYGRPAFPNDYCSTLGDEGDIILVNWSQYLEGTYQPFETAESVHVRFLENERTFRTTKRNAAKCWWRSEFTPPVSAVTRSPVVTLKERA